MAASATATCCASPIKTEADRQRGVRGAEGLPPKAASRAIDEYLAVLDDAGRVRYQSRLISDFFNAIGQEADLRWWALKWIVLSQSPLIVTV